MSDGQFTPAFEERKTEAADENVPPLRNETQIQKPSSSGTDTARSTLQE